MNDATVSDLLRQVSINTENKLMAFSNSSWQEFPDTGISTVECIIFQLGGPIYNDTHVPGTVYQSFSESEYNAACTTGINLAHFRILIHEFLSKGLDIVPEEAPLIILDSKFDVCMGNNSEDIKHKRHISRTVNFVSNVKNCKIHKIDWCDGGL